MKKEKINTKFTSREALEIKLMVQDAINVMSSNMENSSHVADIEDSAKYILVCCSILKKLQHLGLENK